MRTTSIYDNEADFYRFARAMKGKVVFSDPRGGNKKAEKSALVLDKDGKPRLIGIHYLSPRRFTCPHAGSCLKDKECLAFNGRFKGGSAKKAINRKTKLYRENPTAYAELLYRDISLYSPTVVGRANGTSDIRWEQIPTLNGQSLYERDPNRQWSEYTKWPLRSRRGCLDLENVHLTFSLSEHPRSIARAADYLNAGYGCSLIIGGPAGMKRQTATANYIKEALLDIGGFGNRVFVDGDKHDHRHADPRGAIALLSPKGNAIHDTSGFVCRFDPSTLEPIDWRKWEPLWQHAA